MCLGFYPGAIATHGTADDGDRDQRISSYLPCLSEVGSFHFETHVFDTGKVVQVGFPACVKFGTAERLSRQGGVDEVRPPRLHSGFAAGSWPRRRLEVRAQVAGNCGKVAIADGEREFVKLVGQRFGKLLNSLDLAFIDNRGLSINDGSAAKCQCRREADRENRDGLRVFRSVHVSGC